MDCTSLCCRTCHCVKMCHTCHLLLLQTLDVASWSRVSQVDRWSCDTHDTHDTHGWIAMPCAAEHEPQYVDGDDAYVKYQNVHTHGPGSWQTGQGCLSDPGDTHDTNDKVVDQGHMGRWIGPPQQVAYLQPTRWCQRGCHSCPSCHVPTERHIHANMCATAITQDSMTPPMKGQG